MLNPQTNPSDACLDALSTYLLGRIPALTIYREWPYGNQKLKYPTVALTHSRPQIMNLPPETIAVGAPNNKGQVVATEIVGEVDFKIYMDLWTANKADRDIYLGLLIGAINAQVDDASGNNNPAGLSLQLTSYFNDWVRYDLDGYNHIDDEAAAQRQERRAKIDLLVNARIIQRRTYYQMSTIEAEVGVEQTTAELDLLDDSIVS